MTRAADVLQGTVDMLILKAVSLAPMHGYGILLRIRQLSNDLLNLPQGSLYPALYRLETRGLLKFEWGESDNNRRAKFYSLTAKGRKMLESEEEQWERLSAGIAAVMGTKTEKA